MATTYAQLKTKIRRSLADPSALTFDDELIDDIISASWAVVSRAAPWRFEEDLTPQTDTSDYTLLSDKFDAPVDEIDVVNVEIRTVSPSRAWKQIEYMGAHPSGLSFSQAGWYLWGGVLCIPDRWVDLLDPDKHVIRVRGYAPWPKCANDEDVLPFSDALEEAVTVYAYVEGLRRLIGSRVLFTQWQTRSNNTDVTMAGLSSDLQLALADWHRQENAIRVLREAPG